MAINGSRAVGYLESAFKERLGVARDQGREQAAEAGLLRRTGKERMRKDFKQQRQMQYATVKHVARIAAFQPRRSHALGGATKGSAKSRGQVMMGVRSGPKKTEGQKRERAASSQTAFSAGGAAQLAGRRRWTTSGGQEDRSTDHSVFHKAQQVLDVFSPNKIFKDKPKGGAAAYGRFSPGGAGQQTTKGGRTTARATGPGGKGSVRGIREAKLLQQKMEAKKARIENFKKRIAPLHGEEAAKRVMHEYERRQEAMYGTGEQEESGGIPSLGGLLTSALFGGGLTPAKLWGDMERV